MAVVTHGAEPSTRVVDLEKIEDRVFGFTAATLLSGGVGLTIFGVLTLVGELSPSFGTSIAFYKPSGPLSGKAVIAVAAWLVTYAVTALALRRRTLPERTTYVTTSILVAIGFLLTFPPVWKLFGA